MPAIRLNAFTTGIAPAVAPELLPDTGAQIATNCRLHSGDIEPLHAGTATYVTAKTGEIRSVFRIVDDAGMAWLAWNEDVDCVKAPIPGLGRYVYSGDGEPRLTTYALATQGGGNTYPNQCRALGLPKPSTTPSVTVSGGTGPTVSRYYVYTFYDDMNQESGPSPLSAMVTGNANGTWAITNMDASPANSGTGTATFSAGLTTFTNSGSAKHWLRVGDQVIIAGVTVAVFEVVSPSVFKVPGNFTGATSWARKAPFGPCTKRLYRTSGTTAQFQLVAEGISGTSYNDTLTDGQILGDELITADWDMPPTDLAGVCVHPSGALVGFSGNELCFSEPYQVHAWPAKYRLRTDYPIRAIAVYGSTIVVATAGVPYTAHGSEPGQFALYNHSGAYPCLSKRSMVATPIGAVYASADGLVQVSDKGVELITANLYNRDQWRLLSPSTMVGAFADGGLFYRVERINAVTGLFEMVKVLWFANAHTEIDLQPTALYTDAQDGKLYYAVENTIYAFDQPSNAYMPQDWQSKEIVLNEPRTLTAAKVVFDTVIPAAQINAMWAAYNAAVAANTTLLGSGDVGGWVNGFALNTCAINGDDLQPAEHPGNATAQVSFTLYADGQPKYSTVVHDSKPFRMLSGYRAHSYSVRLTSTCRIKQIELADSPIELKRV